MGRKLDELLAIADARGYSGDAPTSVKAAIKAIADTLAGEDVGEVNGIADAINALAPYIGAGGGASVGALVKVNHCGEAPTVGDSYVSDMGCSNVASISIGDSLLIDCGTSELVLGTIAAGATVTTLDRLIPNGGKTIEESIAFYIVEYDPTNYGAVTSVTPTTVEHETEEDQESQGMYSLSYVVPEITGSNKALWVQYVLSD